MEFRHNWTMRSPQARLLLKLIKQQQPEQQIKTPLFHRFSVFGVQNGLQDFIIFKVLHNNTTYPYYEKNYNLNSSNLTVYELQVQPIMYENFVNQVIMHRQRPPSANKPGVITTAGLNKHATKNQPKPPSTYYNNSRYQQPQKKTETGYTFQFQQFQRQNLERDKPIMKQSITKEEIKPYQNQPTYQNQPSYQNPTTYQNYVPSTKLGAGNVKIADLGQYQGTPSTEKPKPRQSMTNDLAPTKNIVSIGNPTRKFANDPVPQNKIPSKEQQQMKRAQEHIKNQYKKLEEEKLKLKQQVFNLQKQKHQISNQVTTIQKQKQAELNQIARLKEETAKLKNNQNQAKTVIKLNSNKNDSFTTGTAAKGYMQEYYQNNNTAYNKNNQSTLSLQNQIETLKRQIQRKDTEIQTLQSNSRQLKTNYRELEQSRRLKRNIEQLEQKSNQSNKKVQQLSSQVTQYETKIKNLNSQKDKVQKQYRNVMLQINDLRKKNTGRMSVDQNQWKDKYDRINKDLERLKQQNERLRQQNEELKSNKNTITSYAQYYKIVKDKQRQIQNYKKQLQNYKNQREPQRLPARQNEELNKKISGLSAEVERLKVENANLLESQKANSSSRQKVTENLDKIRSLESDNKRAQTQVTKLRNQLQQAKKDIERYKQHLNYKQKSLNTTQIQNKTLSAKINELTQNIRELKQKTETPNKQLNALRTQLQNQRNKLNAKNTSLQTQLGNYRTQLAKLREENNRLTNDKSSLSPMKARNNELIQQNESLKKQIREQTSRYQKKQQQIRTLKGQVQRSNAKNKQLQGLKAQVVQKQSTIRKKDEEFSKLLKISQQKDKSLEKYRSQLQKLQANVKMLQSERQSQKVGRTAEGKLKQEYNNVAKEVVNLRESVKLKEEQCRKKAEQTVKIRQQKTNQVKALNSELIHKQKVIENLQNNSYVNNNNFQSMKERLQREKKKLQSQANEKAIKLQRMTSELESLKLKSKKDVDSLQTQIKNRETTIENLQQQLQKAQFVAKNRPVTEVVGPSFDKTIQSLQQENKKLMRRLQQREGYLKQIQNQHNALSNNYSQLSNDFSTLQKEKDQLQKEFDISHQKYEQLLYSHNKENKRGGGASQQINRLNQNYQELSQDFSQLQKNRDQLQKRHELLLAQNNDLKQEKRRGSYQSNISMQQRQITKLRNENTNLVKKLGQLRQDLEVQKQSYKQVQRVSDEHYQLKMNYEEMQAKLKVKSSELQNRNREILQLKDKNVTITKEFSQLKSRIAEIEARNRMSSQNSRQIQLKNRQINNLRQQNLKLSQEISSLKQICSDFERKSQMLAKKVERIQGGGSVSSNVSNDIRHLFTGDVLRGEDQNKIFIKECIQKHLNITIVDTRLIYRYDPLSKQNIHKYIDEKPQLVVIVKLLNGNLIAGYAQGMFKPKTPSDKSGLIMSLTNKKCYYLVQKNKRAIAYDDFFVIFGNSEIRIKSQQKKMFSNFGLSNSYYRHNGDGVGIMMGGTKTEREMEIVAYQFFQLILQS